MLKKRKVVEGYEDCGLDEFACEYCGQTPDQTEIQQAYASGTYICGEINCWNDYMWEWVWTGDTIEVVDEEYECCDDCEEEEDECICESEEE
tara:strand:- start:484 stop:759 length:276 start_codon:yes stop_codon:yes gene_type:complete